MYSGSRNYVGGIKLSASRDLDVHWCRPDEYGYRSLRRAPKHAKGTDKDVRAAEKAEHQRLEDLWKAHCPDAIDREEMWEAIGVVHLDPATLPDAGEAITDLIEVRVSNLVGAPLDWAVAMAEGFTIDPECRTTGLPADLCYAGGPAGAGVWCYCPTALIAFCRGLVEFMFFTGLRLSEALAVRWDVIDMEKRTVHVKRTVALGEVEERTKTGRDRFVLLNELGIRRRPPYNCRHTYATIRLMSGLNPAFIAQQLGHSVQMLLSTYARWLNSSSDWSELEKLKIGIKSVSG